MSINHFSSPDTLWWNQMDPNSRAPNSWPFHQDPHRHVLLNSQQSASMLLQQSPNPTPTRNFNLNGGEDEVEIEIDRHLDVLDREPMFEKPLTPSDVGKLNRLVIPKQHAERYFPLGGGGESGGDKGLLLAFEDESGKAWRFRYSYWNSSQSYVLTKGWSRYVKEKKLDAGDAVLFHRHRTDCERFFIGWRRRNHNNNNDLSAAAAQDSSGGGGFYRAHSYPAPFRQQPHDCTHHHHDHHAGSIGGGSNVVPAGNMKRLRLFGVNMECHADESSEPSTPDGSSSTVTNHGGGPNYNYDQQRHYYYSPPDQYYVVGGS